MTMKKGELKRMVKKGLLEVKANLSYDDTGAHDIKTGWLPVAFGEFNFYPVDTFTIPECVFRYKYSRTRDGDNPGETILYAGNDKFVFRLRNA